MENIGVYKAIAAVQSELAAIGISKDKQNEMQHYSFRGIDDVYGALAPILAKNKLCVLPRVISRTCEERQTQKGGVLYSVTVESEFDLVSAEDGSKHTIRTIGEAMDSADKATNKAMSAAYKYAAFQAFCIPVEGMEDADATTPEPLAKQSAPKAEPKHDSGKQQQADAKAHFCSIHQTAYFKSGKMENFAHPIKDEFGKSTGKWCQEPKAKAEIPERKETVCPKDYKEFCQWVVDHHLNMKEVWGYLGCNSAAQMEKIGPYSQLCPRIETWINIGKPTQDEFAEMFPVGAH